MVLPVSRHILLGTVPKCGVKNCPRTNDPASAVMPVRRLFLLLEVGDVVVADDEW
jgi:hypothetical protein